jgi:hypothetical protein
MLAKRLGNFLFVIGALILLVFAGSAMVDNAQYELFFIGLIVTAGGVLWMRRGAESTTPVKRFGLIHRFNRKDQKPQDKG